VLPGATAPLAQLWLRPTQQVHSAEVQQFPCTIRNFRGLYAVEQNSSVSLLRRRDHSLVFSPKGRSGRSQSPVMEPIWLLAHCILGKFLGVVCHCFPPRLDVPTFAATCLCVRSDARDPSSERWNCGLGEKDVRY